MSTLFAGLTEQELNYIVEDPQTGSEMLVALAKQELIDRACNVDQMVAKLKSLGYVVLSPAERESDGCPFCGQVMV